jgi:hypothetical protein
VGSSPEKHSADNTHPGLLCDEHELLHSETCSVATNSPSPSPTSTSTSTSIRTPTVTLPVVTLSSTSTTPTKKTQTQPYPARAPPPPPGRSNQLFIVRRSRAPALNIRSVLGKGAFGTVYLCQAASAGGSQSQSHKQRRYALKVIPKNKLTSDHAVRKASLEVQTLKQTSHPFIVNLADAFQSDSRLYLLMDYAQGGDLFHHLTLSTRFSETRSQLYLAEVASALGHIHAHNIIYSDLKPENVLLDEAGHVKLTDFGMCSRISGIKRSRSACGTPTYTSPEVVRGLPHGCEVDWWASGVLLYEMLTGVPPFRDSSIQRLYEKILFEPLRVPAYVSAGAKSMIEALLVRNPSRRLGGRGKKLGSAGASRVGGTAAVGGRDRDHLIQVVVQPDVEQVKQHFYFRNLDWVAVMDRRVQPEYVPTLESGQPFDTQYFDSCFTDLSVSTQLAKNNEQPMRKDDASIQYQQEHRASGGAEVKYRLSELKHVAVAGYRRTHDVEAVLATAG